MRHDRQEVCGDAREQPKFVEEDVSQLVEMTKLNLGRLDMWVNNAGVTLFAPLEAA